MKALFLDGPAAGEIREIGPDTRNAYILPASLLSPLASGIPELLPPRQVTYYRHSFSIMGAWFCVMSVYLDPEKAASEEVMLMMISDKMKEVRVR